MTRPGFHTGRPLALPNASTADRENTYLTVIARRNGVTVTALRRANGLNSSRIRAGQTLRIPRPG